MKLSEKIATRSRYRPFYTFEFFPPKTDQVQSFFFFLRDQQISDGQVKQGFENLLSRIARLSALNPLAISITWGAGGSTMGRSLELAGMTQAEHHIDTIMHLTCTNMEKGMVDTALRVRINLLQYDTRKYLIGST